MHEKALSQALSHPARQRILRYLIDHGQASAADVARAHYSQIPAASYHFRKLAALGMLTDPDITYIRGAAQRTYRLTDLGKQAAAHVNSAAQPPGNSA